MQHIGHDFKNSVVLDLMPGRDPNIYLGHLEIHIDWISTPSQSMGVTEFNSTSFHTLSFTKISVASDVYSFSYRLISMNNSVASIYRPITIRVDQLILLNLAVKLLNK